MGMGLDGEAAEGEFVLGFDGAGDGDAAFEPCGELGEAVFEADARFVSKNSLREGDVGEAVADVAGAILAGDDGFQILAIENVGEAGGDVAYGDMAAAADVEG